MTKISYSGYRFPPEIIWCRALLTLLNRDNQPHGETMGMLSKAAAIGALWVSTAAHGEVELSGSFTATQACRAFQSIRKQSNPGNVRIEPGRAYPILGKIPEPQLSESTRQRLAAAMPGVQSGLEHHEWVLVV